MDENYGRIELSEPAGPKLLDTNPPSQRERRCEKSKLPHSPVSVLRAGDRPSWSCRSSPAPASTAAARSLRANPHFLRTAIQYLLGQPVYPPIFPHRLFPGSG